MALKHREVEQHLRVNQEEVDDEINVPVSASSSHMACIQASFGRNFGHSVYNASAAPLKWGYP
jgi:hypothetical protein